MARARLLVETGKPDQPIRLLLSVEKELTGKDNIVVEGALYDALLEQFRNKRGNLLQEWRERLRNLPNPIFDRGFHLNHY